MRCVILYRASEGFTGREEIWSQHLTYVRSLYANGKVLIGGPFHHSRSAIGMVLAEVTDGAEAHRLVAQDPAIQAGEVVPEVYVLAPIVDLLADRQ